jgi:hypothetical protein
MQQKGRTMPDSYGTVMGEPDMISAGDFIRFMRTAGEIGMNLISGSTGIVPKPGFVYIGERLAEKSNETGGTIMTGQNYVEKVMPPYHR